MCCCAETKSVRSSAEVIVKLMYYGPNLSLFGHGFYPGCQSLSVG